MGSGFEVYNADTHAIQFSSSLMSYRFASKGTVYTQAVPYGTSPSRALIPANRNTDQFIAVRSQYTIARGGTGETAINDNYDVYQSDGPVGTPVDYYVFDKVSTLSSLPKYGLEFYHPDTHELTFSAVAPFAIAKGKLTPQFPRRVFTSGNYAAVLPNFAGYSKIYYDHQIQQEVGEKGQHLYWYYQYTQYGRLYGVQCDANYTSFQINEVSYADATGPYIVPSQTTPPPDDQVEFDIPIGLVLLIDVTRF